MKIMNKTEMIKAGFKGVKTYKHPETGEDIVIDWDDPEKGCLLTAKEASIVFGKRGKNGQRIFSEIEEEVHYSGDEFEDLEFLKKYDNL